MRPVPRRRPLSPSLLIPYISRPALTKPAGAPIHGAASHRPRAFAPRHAASGRHPAVGHSPLPARQDRKVIIRSSAPPRHHQGELPIFAEAWALQTARSGGVGRVGLEPTTDGL
ncbi:conserved hypothetical protein [Frankia canadensis]|uniref:Uncharacterized protein n=1 Tax=Frankia canadensis TaxID=1836972 RepID=A0A2I2KMC6_9ACTN|nr:conserved hypothetical protein [Frankia canadensis]SOU54093.1 conserved hypothetical protein [Frankia canadensis]